MTCVRRVGGRYLLEHELGRGAMGTVWAARDEVLRREVAVKEVRPPATVTSAEERRLRARTLGEACAAARITSDSALTVYDVVDEGPSSYIVMERLSGRTLADRLAVSGPLSQREAAVMGMRLLEALEAAHAAGVVHRDVKPSNVLIEDDGRVVLGDFGIASLDGDGCGDGEGLNLGSPAYAAPERVRGLPATAASDLWSFGVTVWAALTGGSPFERGDPRATLEAVLAGAPSVPVRSGPLRPLLQGLLGSDPRRRTTAPAARRLLLAASGLAPAAEQTQPIVPLPAPPPPRSVLRMHASPVLSRAGRSARRPLVALLAALLLSSVGAAAVSLSSDAVSENPGRTEVQPHDTSPIRDAVQRGAHKRPSPVGPPVATVAVDAASDERAVRGNGHEVEDEPAREDEPTGH